MILVYRYGIAAPHEGADLVEAQLRAAHEYHCALARIERQAESDDEVRSNIPPELVALFERVKRGIKASPRMSRTEAFLQLGTFCSLRLI